MNDLCKSVANDLELIAEVQQQLQHYQGSMVWVALSGGVDSVVLLHAVREMAQTLQLQVEAVHVNHHLSKYADYWQSFVSELCEKWQIPLTIEHVCVEPSKGEGLEACARALRYEAILKNMQVDDVLLTGHHADDQVETMLHHLFRGSGMTGLSAMKQVDKKEHYLHVRPLLKMSRDAIESYANQQGLVWVEDDSNADCSLRRNFIRQQVLPLLVTEYPGIKTALQRSRDLVELHESCLMYYVAQDYTKVADGTTLSISQLRTLDSKVHPFVLRYWFKENGIAAPSQVLLQRILREVITAREDAMPIVEWDQVALRRYQDTLFILPRHLPEVSTFSTEWELSAPLHLPEGLGQLQSNRSSQQRLVVKFAQVGEQIKSRQDGYTKKLKHIFQEQRIPPWHRLLMPMLYDLQGRLLMVPGVVESHHFSKEFGDDLDIIWQKGAVFS